MSSSGKPENGNSKLTEKTAPTTKGTEDAVKEGVSKEEGTAESLDPRAFLLGTRESLLKVAEFQVGDMIATYAIVLLLAMILLSPIVGQ